MPAAIAVVTGESIALGIFLTPAAMAKSLGSPLLLGWLAWHRLDGHVRRSLLFRAGDPLPESGGEYVYLRAGYGEQVAFLYGWMSSIVMYPGVAAALAVGVALMWPSCSPWRARAGFCSCTAHLHLRLH